MHNLVSDKPDKITKDSSKNLEKISFCFGDAKNEMRENDTFDLVWETKRVLGEGI
jgi:hypothetical protein